MFRYKKDDQTRKPNPIIIRMLEIKRAAANIIRRVITARIYSLPGFRAVVIIVPRVLNLSYLRSNSFPRKRPITKAISRL